MAFEAEVVAAIAAGKIHTPTHLCGGNEEQLLGIFREVDPEDWVFCSYRNHYHALLYGVPPAEVMAQILAGRSMTPHYPGRKFFTSALVGGCLPIAVGVAAALKRKDSFRKVWCFLGDMAATTGAFHEARKYADGHSLPITFIVEDNGLSCDTPTAETWGPQAWSGQYSSIVRRYSYRRSHPHRGARH